MISDLISENDKKGFEYNLNEIYFISDLENNLVDHYTLYKKGYKYIHGSDKKVYEIIWNIKDIKVNYRENTNYVIINNEQTFISENQIIPYRDIVISENQQVIIDGVDEYTYIKSISNHVIMELELSNNISDIELFKENIKTDLIISKDLNSNYDIYLSQNDGMVSVDSWKEYLDNAGKVDENLIDYIDPEIIKEISPYVNSYEYNLNKNRYNIIDNSSNRIKLAEDKYNSTWDLSKVTNMSKMFKNALSFNLNISLWNVSKVENMSHMFEDAFNFNNSISLWDVSSVKNMSYMFKNNSDLIIDFSLNLYNGMLVT